MERQSINRCKHKETNIDEKAERKREEERQRDMKRERQM